MWLQRLASWPTSPLGGGEQSLSEPTTLAEVAAAARKRRSAQKNRRIIFTFHQEHVAVGVAITTPLSLHMEYVSGEQYNLCGHFCIESWEEEKELRKIYSALLALVTYGLPTIVITYTSISIYRVLAKVVRWWQWQ